MFLLILNIVYDNISNLYTNCRPKTANFGQLYITIFVIEIFRKAREVFGKNRNFGQKSRNLHQNAKTL